MVGIERKIESIDINQRITNKKINVSLLFNLLSTVFSIATFILIAFIVICPVHSAEIDSRPDIRPIDSNKIVSIVRGFTDTHFGIDFSCYVDTEIKATASGKVIFARYCAGYGNCIIIKHDWIGRNGKAKTAYTVYGHLSEFLVLRGQTVSKRQIIALSGSTGRSDGPHLHYELRNENNKPIFNGTYQAENKIEDRK